MEKNSYIPTGIPGLDDILGGGLTAGKMYLLAGGPGTGKTTFALQFIGEGIRRRERCLYVTVAGEKGDLPSLADSLGISLDPDYLSVHAVEINDEVLNGPEQSIFHPLETGLSDMIKSVLAEVRQVKPQRLVIDSLADLRIISENSISYHRLLFLLLREFNKEDCTVLLTNYGSQNEIDLHLEAIAHGVMYVEQLIRDYGPTRRRFIIHKLRERAYRSGWHDFRILADGIRIYPVLRTDDRLQNKQKDLIFSGNAQLDDLFGGGLDRGGSIALIGASGTGKTTLANVYAVAAAARGERAVICLFEETEDSYRGRAEGLGMGVDDYIAKGLISLRQISIAELSPGEFSAMIRHEVEENNAKVIVLDTLSGYASAMPEEKYITLQLHETLIYLTHKGVTTFLAIEQHGIFGAGEEVSEVSYLADTIILLRFFEHNSRIRKSISVIKKRRGKHDTALRELIFSGKGLHLGESLSKLKGVPTGVSASGTE